MAKKLKCNGCVKSKNMKRTIVLGRNGKVGNFGVRDGSGNTTVNLDGGSGNVTNSLSGNGLAKAWARINSNGTVLSCYRCNVNGAETRRLSEGMYEVDFTPLGTDIQSRPRLCTPEGGDSVDNTCSTAGSGDTSSVVVRLYDVPNNAFTAVQGKIQDGPFTIVIF